MHNAREITLIHHQQAMGQIDEQLKKRGPEFDRRLKEIIRANVNRRSKMRQLFVLLDDIRKLTQPYIPCHKGCSNCCYQRVIVTQVEAEAIGQAIGVDPVKLPGAFRPKEESEFSPRTPCSFLDAEAGCAIYEHRPMMCRHYINIDVDAVACSFENWEKAKAGDPTALAIPMSGCGPVLQAYAELSGHGALGDIRDFFPKGLHK